MPLEVCDMQQIYCGHGLRGSIEPQDGAPTVKGCTLFGPPVSAAVAGDADLIVPDGIVVERCPPGVAQGASSWGWRSTDGIGLRGSRTAARGGA